MINSRYSTTRPMIRSGTMYLADPTVMCSYSSPSGAFFGVMGKMGKMGKRYSSMLGLDLILVLG